jgi:hypothetical protein
MHPHLRKMAAMLHHARPSFMHAQFVRSMENMQGGREGEKRDGSDRAAVLFISEVRAEVIIMNQQRDSTNEL